MFTSKLKNQPPASNTEITSCELIKDLYRRSRQTKNKMFKINATLLKNKNPFIRVKMLSIPQNTIILPH